MDAGLFAASELATIIGSITELENLAYMGGQALDSVWIHFNTQTNNNNLAFYGISSTLTVPQSQGVPEPGTITMMVAGAFLMAGAKRYQRRQRARGTNPKAS